MTIKRDGFIPEFLEKRIWYHEFLNGQPKELAIRVWWGLMNPGLSIPPNKGEETFKKGLSEDFMPGTVYLMCYMLGALIGYLPTVLLDLAKAFAGVPHEVALVVYASIAEYNKAAANWFGKLYQHIHAWLFAIPPSSSKGFPKLFQRKEDGQAEPALLLDQPYFLYTRPNVNWQSGITRLIIATPKDNTTAEQFRNTIEKAAEELQFAYPGASADCVVLRASAQCLTLWRHFAEGVEPIDEDIQEFLNEVQVVGIRDSVKVTVPPKSEFNLTDTSWFKVERGDEFPNFQFETGQPEEQPDDGLISM